MSNNNVFKVANPCSIMEDLWNMIESYKEDFSRLLIFMPSRRAIREFEKLIYKKIGHATLLPNLIPLGTGVESGEEDDDSAISNQERVIRLAGLLMNVPGIKNISVALPFAHDFIRMQDYLENEGKKLNDIDLDEIIGNPNISEQFTYKAKLIKILSDFIKDSDIKTTTEQRNESIKAWVEKFDKYELVIVCGSTASVPSTADLMVEIANRKNGRIILSGKIDGDPKDFELETNPYYAEYKFLQRLNLSHNDIETLGDTENKYIDGLNIAFSNSGKVLEKKLDNFTLVECLRESQEAAVATQIAKEAIERGDSVLIITPDAAANQRIKTEMARCNIKADFSSGIPGTMSHLGRSLLNLVDYFADSDEQEFYNLLDKSKNNIFDMLVEIVDDPEKKYKLKPGFDIQSEAEYPIWNSVKTMALSLKKIIDDGIKVDIYDIRAFIEDAISAVSIRQPSENDYQVRVLGTIESRMQTADVVILTGLNEGMFPSVGYENSWLPRSVAKKIGLPSPDKKVSLMALDFINLSCSDKVYWLRTVQTGGAKNIESRFISRICVVNGMIKPDTSWLAKVDKRDNDIEPDRIVFKDPVPSKIDTSDVYVTALNNLIKNPYIFYIQNVLGLKIKDDYWALPDSRKFGIVVHDAVENSEDMTKEDLIARMDEAVSDIKEEHPVLFSFWHKKFCEFAEIAEKYGKDILTAKKEKEGKVDIEGRTVRAKADVIWENGDVLDIKTGKNVPSENDLLNGEAPQLPLEAYMMQNNGFKDIQSDCSQIIPTLKFLRFIKTKKKDEYLVEYSGEKAEEIINNTVDKITELFRTYKQPGVKYEYIEEDGNEDLYKKYDGFSRKHD